MALWHLGMASDADGPALDADAHVGGWVGRAAKGMHCWSVRNVLPRLHAGRALSCTDGLTAGIQMTVCMLQACRKA